MAQINVTNDLISIGGHFSALLDNHDNSVKGNYAYESARSALYALIRAKSAKRIHIPNYICSAIPEAISASGATAIKYQINDQFEVAEKLDYQKDDLIILVNYFGLNSRSIHQDLKKMPYHAVVVDCSQSYFSEPFDCLATIYSPRKFIPVPDGGLIHSSINLEATNSDNQASIRRYEYLLQRLQGEPEVSRHLYLMAEASLNDISFREISEHTKKIIKSIDLEYIRQRRIQNFTNLSELNNYNLIKFSLDNQVPLCYPLMVSEGRKLRDYLLKKRVFTPIYWPDVIGVNLFEKKMISDVIFLPIDHRYKDSEMNYLKNIIKNFYGWN